MVFGIKSVVFKECMQSKCSIYNPINNRKKKTFETASLRRDVYGLDWILVQQYFPFSKGKQAASGGGLIKKDHRFIFTV